MRETYEVTLISKSGDEVKAVVGKPWIARLEKVNALMVKQTLLRERRTALYIQTNDINSDLAKAEVAGDAAAATAARKKLETIETGMAECNSKAAEHLVSQLKEILELPGKETEIDWTKVEQEEAGAAIVFFLNGKRPSPESATG